MPLFRSVPIAISICATGFLSSACADRYFDLCGLLFRSVLLFRSMPIRLFRSVPTVILVCADCYFGVLLF